MENITPEERLSALENQAYVMYLQLNAITKIFIDKNMLDKDLLEKEMDELNNKLYQITQGEEKDPNEDSSRQSFPHWKKS